jgi:hypothetical protein
MVVSHYAERLYAGAPVTAGADGIIRGWSRHR